jgi:hypothetical protein
MYFPADLSLPPFRICNRRFFSVCGDRVGEFKKIESLLHVSIYFGVQRFFPENYAAISGAIIVFDSEKTHPPRIFKEYDKADGHAFPPPKHV